MKIMVTGAGGQLGRAVSERLVFLGLEHLSADKTVCDITDPQQSEDLIRDYCPDAVIHCAAYTAVDKAEDEKELCRRVNVGGTGNIAKACRLAGAKLLYISTDYVFDGEDERPYETDARRAPINFYGLTKALGEDEVKQALDEHFIVRTSWVFGPGGRNFVGTMLRLGGQRGEIDVVSDQVGSPTCTRDLAVLLCDMVKTDKYGTYHATNEGYCSWAEFAKEIFRQAGVPVKINPISSGQYHSKAMRPRNSRLSKKSLDLAGYSRLENWEKALAEYLDETMGKDNG